MSDNSKHVQFFGRPRPKLRPILQLAQLVVWDDTPRSHAPWFIIETYLTSEGARTRVCSGRWKTKEEAGSVLIERKKAMDE